MPLVNKQTPHRSPPHRPSRLAHSGAKQAKKFYGALSPLAVGSQMEPVPVRADKSEVLRESAQAVRRTKDF